MVVGLDEGLAVEGDLLGLVVVGNFVGPLVGLLEDGEAVGLVVVGEELGR